MPDYSEQREHLEMQKAYLNQFDKEWQIVTNMASSVAVRLEKHRELLPLSKEIDELRTGYFNLKKNYKRMKWSTFTKRAVNLFARTSELKAIAQEQLKAIQEKEYVQSIVGIKTGQIKEEENPKTERKKKTVQNKDEGQVSLSLKGGKRPGAGRPSKGVKKPITMALPQEHWEYLDSLIQKGEFKGYTDVFRQALYSDHPEIAGQDS